jgi:hypothetical protein
MSSGKDQRAGEEDDKRQKRSRFEHRASRGTPGADNRLSKHDEPDGGAINGGNRRRNNHRPGGRITSTRCDEVKNCNLRRLREKSRNEGLYYGEHLAARGARAQYFSKSFLRLAYLMKVDRPTLTVSILLSVISS